MMSTDVRFELNGDAFVWHAEKARKNVLKHSFRFEDAAAVFFDPMFVLMRASRNDEAREAAVGFDAIGRLLYVVHIEIDGDAIRIISARRAELHEEKIYVD